MGIIDKIFEAFTATIKFSQTINGLTHDIREITQELKNFDRRLVRLETYLEIAEKRERLGLLFDEKVI